MIPGRGDRSSRRSLNLLGLGGQGCAGAGVWAAVGQDGERGMEGDEHEAVGGECCDPGVMAQPWLLHSDAVSWPSPPWTRCG